MRKLFLHIGANKTGSTALQFYLNSNYLKLLDEGFLYPRAGCIGDCHHGIAAKLGFTSDPELKILADINLAEIHTQFNKEVNLHTPHTVIVSSESFVLPGDPKAVKRFFCDFDVKIVLYLRRHDHWLRSLYNQAVKTNYNPSWPRGINGYLQYLSTPNIANQVAYINYRWLVSRWAKEFGESNVCCIPYEPKFREKSLFEDFHEIANIPRSIDISAVHRLNESIPERTLIAIDYINRTNLPVDRKEMLCSYILSQSEDNKNEKKFDFSNELRIKILNEHIDSYNWLATNYGFFCGTTFFSEPWPQVDVSV